MSVPFFECAFPRFLPEGLHSISCAFCVFRSIFNKKIQLFSSGTKLLYADFAPNRNPFKLLHPNPARLSSL